MSGGEGGEGVSEYHQFGKFSGPCDHVGCSSSVASVGTYPDGHVERLCSEHGTERVQAANLETYTQQKAERERLRNGNYIPIVLHVSTDLNLDGQYCASVGNPINSCAVGFGSTPYRALRELGLRISENADSILHRITEHEMELRVAARAPQENPNE